MSKNKTVLQALLGLLLVQSELEVCADAGTPIKPEQAKKLARHVESSRDLLQATLLRAAQILEGGPQ